MKIYNRIGQLLLDVDVEDNSFRNRQIMGDNTLTLYYSLPEHVELPVGAWCIYQSEEYTLTRPENLKMQHTRAFEYTVTLDGERAKTKFWKFKNTVDGRLKFPLTAKPHEHLQMFVDNMNMRDSGWSLGECISDTEKLISYDHDYCLDALAKMAQEFDTEYEINGKRVSLHKVEYNKNNPLDLSYGKGNGLLPGIGRTSSGDIPPIEVLYVQGGSTNIDRSKYGAGELHLPVDQSIAYDGEHFEDEEGYNPTNARHYQVDSIGSSVTDTDRTYAGHAEDSLDRTEDYPKRVGTTNDVVTVDVEKHFYDFIDTAIPQDLDYTQCLIEGETMTVIFQSGMLAGREFDVKYYHTAVSGKKARRFEIVPQEMDGVTMPSETFKPVPGDTYAVFGVQLPDAYICDNATKTGAEWDMLRAAVRYLYDNEEQKITFSGELDGIWAKKNWLSVGGRIRLGGFVRFTDERFQQEGVLVRIVGIKDYINSPYSPKIELSNETVTAGLVSTIKTLEAQEVVMENDKREMIQFTKRRFRDAQETSEMLAEAFKDAFTEGISPVTVNTMQLLVGDERLQFQFVHPLTKVPISHIVTWNSDTRKLFAEDGCIQHMTLGIDSLCPTHDESEYRYYTMPPYVSPVLEDGSVKYYLYARVPEGAAGKTVRGTFLLETSTHDFHEGNYYWLLYGVLNSEYMGERSFVTLHGFTEILPGRITTDRIVSTDGKNIIDLQTAFMQLGDALQYNKDGDQTLWLKFLAAENSSLGGWILKNDLLISQKGTVNGIERDYDTVEEGETFVPYVSLDGRTGAIRQADNIVIDTDGIALLNDKGEIACNIKNSSVGSIKGNAAGDKSEAFSFSRPQYLPYGTEGGKLEQTFELARIDLGSYLEEDTITYTHADLSFQVPRRAGYSSEPQIYCPFALMKATLMKGETAMQTLASVNMATRTPGGSQVTLAHDTPKTTVIDADSIGRYYVSISLSFELESETSATLTDLYVHGTLSYSYSRHGSVKTIIGNDGFYTSWKANQYIHAQRESILLRHGLHAIRLSENGLQKSHDGGDTWQDL